MLNTQEDFLEAANNWCNIFLTWIAWSGKTYILNKWKEQNKDKTIITVAPTWIAAIQSWWSTIHSAFKLYWDNYHVIKRQDIDWSEVDVLVVDEISMVSCEMFSFMHDVISQNRYNDEIFWWIQVIVIGDLAQLPPIYDLRNEDTKRRYDKLMSELWWVTFNFSKHFKWFTEINLTIPQRSHDDRLNLLLNRIRANDMLALYEFKTDWYTTRFYNSATHIYPYNNQVDSHNYDRLVKLPWKQFIYKWTVTGDFNLNNVLTPEELKIKIGCRVMIIKNLECWLVNWDTWEVISIDWDEIRILSDRLELEFNIWIEKWENIKYDSHWNKDVIWKFYQYPLKLWYAITAHKAQWLSLDKVIFHYNKSLSKELVYVALSRARTYDNLYVIK